MKNKTKTKSNVQATMPEMPPTMSEIDERKRDVIFATANVLYRYDLPVRDFYLVNTIFLARSAFNIPVPFEYKPYDLYRSYDINRDMFYILEYYYWNPSKQKPCRQITDRYDTCYIDTNLIEEAEKRLPPDWIVAFEKVCKFIKNKDKDSILCIVMILGLYALDKWQNHLDLIVETIQKQKPEFRTEFIKKAYKEAMKLMRA